MISIRNKTVNVSRLDLLKTLKENLEKYRDDYAEAMADYHLKLKIDLKAALETVEAPLGLSYSEIRKVHVDFKCPQDYEPQYLEAIEMLEWSADETISLDAESFRAYIKNEWPWTDSFKSQLTSNKSYLVSAGLLDRM